ncbi:MAG: PD40 domain-containing protein [Anaerolinea sp.]|nr:PD40 domain-containing protein [Anaerolinea sp.]MCC6976465.1 PD40 domain-containing protein [Anaerolineae bacterium]CAG0997021.1 hypothetical protein ANRL4_02849 [Anaerolineae bacterium]
MKKLIPCLTLIILLWGSGLWRTSYAQDATVQEKSPQADQVVERCLQEVTPDQLSLRGSIYYESTRFGHLWRLNTELVSEAVELYPPSPGIVYALTDTAHKTLIVFGRMAAPTIRPLSFYLIQQGKVIKYYKADLTWDSPLTWTHNNRLVVNQDASEPAQNGFLLLNTGGESLTVETYTDFPHAMRVTQVPHNGFQVSPQEDRVIYGALWGEGLSRARGLALAELPSKRVIWSTTENHLWSDWWSEPLWSPDGTQFAYVHQDYSNSRLNIALVNKNGKQRLVTDFQGDAEHFELISTLLWSPDGHKLAFWMYEPFSLLQADHPSDLQSLYILDLRDGTVIATCHRMQRYWDMGITWSPDSTSLAYVEGKQLFLLDIDKGLKSAVALDGLRVLGWLDD